MKQIVMPALNRQESASLPLAVGAGFAPSLAEKDGNLWQQWITDKTCLTPDISQQTGAKDALRFPDAMLPLLPRQSGRDPCGEYGRHGWQ